MEVLQDREREFYRQCGLAYELDADEKPCAVVWLRDSPPDAAVRQFGRALEAWKNGQRPVRRILGLAPMLEGQTPLVATFLVWGRYYMRDRDPGTWMMSLALVTIDAGAEGDDVTASLADVVRASGIANCQPHARYLYDYR